MDTKTGLSGHDHHHRAENSHATHGMHHDHEAANTTTVKDPVCGMNVTLGAGKPSFEHDSKTWHFCSQKCHDKFAADPVHYLTGEHKKAAAQATAPASAGTLYTCPMHSETIRDAPGDCPKCGMALESMGVPSGDGGPTPSWSTSGAGS